MCSGIMCQSVQHHQRTLDGWTYGCDIRRWDRQVRDLEVLNSINVELRVDDTTFLAWLHSTCAELHDPFSKPDKIFA